MPLTDSQHLPTATRRRPKPRSRPVRPAPEFPGCRPFRLRREDLETYEGRFEYWDGDTETAWKVREPTSVTHERPSQRLARLAELIAQTRGSRVRTVGTADLMLRDEHGAKSRIMQADQCVYAHPERADIPFDGPEIVIGEHDFPDVVLEVDHTTDVRRGKLWLYEEWGFPEVWVEVPEAGYPVRRASGAPPGLTVYVRKGGVYRTASASRAFPGWTAEEIHAAMNEPGMSADTSRVLRRVGRAMGKRQGTAPGDLPWLRMERREAKAEGRAEGRVEGERALLVRLAARRFGRGTGARLSELLARTDAAHFAAAGEAIIVSGSGADLIERAKALVSR